MYELGLKEVLKKYGIIYCVVAHLDSELVETYGDKGGLAYQDLVKTHFYNFETIQALNNFLADQPKPKLFRQGEVASIMCKPKQDTIVGLFYHEQREFPEYFKWAKEVDREIETAWNNQ